MFEPESDEESDISLESAACTAYDTLSYITVSAQVHLLQLPCCTSQARETLF